jgi:predicted nucleic acid-binding protein
MVKYIKRKTDNKFLNSTENDIWVDNRNMALKMTYRECEETKQKLLETYSSEDILEIVSMTEHKIISEEEKKELRNLLKKS